MDGLDSLLTRLETSIAEVDALEEPARSHVFELLDGIDTLHRLALTELGTELGAERLDAARAAHPAIAWLFDAYGIGVDERAAAEAALETVRPYIHSHGGRVEVLDATDGVVRLRMAGACAGCTASAATLRDGIEQALAEGLPGFVGVEAIEEEAAPHPPPAPPGATLLPLHNGHG